MLRNLKYFAGVVALCAAFGTGCSGAVSEETPVKVIFDTDMGNDVDDVLALDMLYKYQDAGKIQLLLISNNKGNAYSAPFIHLMNDFYGWSGIPVASSPAELLPRQKEKQPSYVEAVAASGVFPASCLLYTSPSPRD